MHRDLFTSLFFSRIRYKTFLLISFYFLLISKSALATDEINMDGPLAYEIRDDHLYVLLNRATHKMWQQEMTENIQISDRLWPQIKSTSASSLR